MNNENEKKYLFKLIEELKSHVDRLNLYVFKLNEKVRELEERLDKNG